jgi:putative ABC transport system permease protein
VLGLTWLRGLVTRRPGRLVATTAGIAIAVALLASIGTFLASSKATMTTRAAANVGVDWQVESQPGADPAAVLDATRGASGVRAALPVEFATTTGLGATTSGTVQSTGPGVILGIPDGYRTAFPGAIRDLAGTGTGVLVFQQTAANLRVAPGDTVTIGRAGLPPARVTVDGVVDLPKADSLFQKVGAPAGAQPQAPPDNVVLLPESQWHQIFDPLATLRPDQVSTQAHVRLSHQLPSDPSAAYSRVSGAARNLEVRLAGAGLVGDNLGATLAAARGDALYAQVLFLFLGVPGAILAGLLTGFVAASGADRRRREQALLRTRGATTRQLVRIGLFEAALVGSIGALGGLGVALLVGRLAFGTVGFGATTISAIGWGAGAAVAGLVIAGAAIAFPAWHDARSTTVAAARATVGRARRPRWARSYLDFALLAGSALVFWLTSRNGYQLVLAPEGTPSISVSYWALAGPALLWVGAGLLVWRVAAAVLDRGRGAVRRVVRPVSHGLSGTVAATMSRERRTLARSVALVALTVAFAASTAVFASTYRAQAEVDARLTNGADVTVTESPGASIGPGGARAIERVPGVRGVEPLQHRFAYVGADLQDLYGVRTNTIVDATKLQDAYFQGGSARGLMARLAQQRDGILVSAETVKDFQLRSGDTLTLRLQDGRTKQYRPVRFRYLGVGKEFPTAPRDSFLIANADYVAQQTGSDGVGAFLVDTGGTAPRTVAERLRSSLGAEVTVTDLATTRKVVGSTLTAVDLSGLTKVELGFAVVLAAAATGLVLALGLAERRRTFAIAAALGAKRRQLGGFVWAEAIFVTGTGFLLGGLTAWVLSEMLVKILTGVFDPPPATLAIPWTYLGIVTAVAVGAVGAAAVAAIRSSSRPSTSILREL